MRIFLTGSTGFIGSYICQALSSQGHIVTCLIRKGSKIKLKAHRAEELHGQSINLIEGEWTQPQNWLDQVAGHDVLINSVGIIREGYRGEFDVVHDRTPIVLFQHAETVGIKKIIQISAMGADDQAVSRFHLSKRKADRYLSSLNIHYLVIRPSFVYGYGGSSMAFFTRLAALPITPVVGDGQYRVQPIHIDDLVKAIVISVKDHTSESGTIDAGGSEILTFDEMLDVLGRQLGTRVRHLHIPWRIMGVIAKTTDLLGGYGLISSDELSMLRRGSVSDNSQFTAMFGFEPMPFSQGIVLSY